MARLVCLAELGAFRLEHLRQRPWHGAGSNGGSGVGHYFGGFWSQMPDFNLKNARVAEWHRDNLRFWLNRGVDGFRFDAVGNLVENGPAAWENQLENAMR